MPDAPASPGAKLLPCPFCGGKAFLCEEADAGGCCVQCLSGDCYAAVGEQYDPRGMPEHAYGSREEAIAAWNRRAPADAATVAAAAEEARAAGLDTAAERLRAQGRKILAESGGSILGVNMQRIYDAEAEWMSLEAAAIRARKGGESNNG